MGAEQGLGAGGFEGTKGPAGRSSSAQRSPSQCRTADEY